MRGREAGLLNAHCGASSNATIAASSSSCGLAANLRQGTDAPARGVSILPYGDRQAAKRIPANSNWAAIPVSIALLK